MIFGLLPHKNVGDLCGGHPPVFIYHCEESIIVSCIPDVIPFFSVRCDKMVVIRLESQERVHGLMQESGKMSKYKDVIITLMGDEEDL
jgi:hypothetical protein